METSNAVQLSVERVQRDDGGLYTLLARTSANQLISREVELIVADQSVGEDPPQFLRRLSDLSIKVGTRARLLVEVLSSTNVKVGEVLHPVLVFVRG